MYINTVKQEKKTPNKLIHFVLKKVMTNKTARHLGSTNLSPNCRKQCMEDSAKQTQVIDTPKAHIFLICLKSGEQSPGKHYSH